MNDIDLLRELGTDLGPAEDTAPLELLVRTQARILDERPGKILLFNGSHHLTRGRPFARTLTAAASVAAVALVGALAVGTLARPGDDGAAFGPGAVAERADGSVDTRLDAGHFLLAAAVTVRAHPAAVPDPAGYVYTRSDQAGVDLASTNDKHQGNRSWTNVREAWLSVDGNHDSWLTPGQSTQLGRLRGCPVTTRSSAPNEEDADADCLHQPAYIADAPTTKKAMLDYLCRTTDGPGCGTQGSAEWNSDVFQHGSDLLSERVAPAPVRAAVFEALSALPDMKVVTNATALDGRRGTSIAFDDVESNRRSEIIFDSRTYEVIGQRHTLLQAEDGATPGTVIWAEAVIEKSVVAQPGLRPDGSRRKLPCTHWICLP